MTTEIMMDLETLGTAPNSVVVAIGAVRMNTTLCTTLDTFYTAVDAASCQKLGLVIEAGTVMWWLRQSDQARTRLAANPLPLAAALAAFSAWVGPEPLPMWGNGSDFDCVLLRNAYNACGLIAPWKYWQSRCYRTLKNMYPWSDPALAPPANSCAHDALADAQWQATHLLNIMKRMQGR